MELCHSSFCPPNPWDSLAFAPLSVGIKKDSVSTTVYFQVCKFHFQERDTYGDVSVPIFSLNFILFN